jgi:hypothetical protein
VALSGGSDGMGKSTASTASPAQREADTQTAATTTVPDRPAGSTLRVRVGGRVVVVEATRPSAFQDMRCDPAGAAPPADA